MISVQDSTCAVLLAERELAAFVGAVTELFGPENARLAAEHWLDEFMSMPGCTHEHWRAITLRAAAQLANSLETPVHPARPVAA